MNEYTALMGIAAPGTSVYGYQRGHEVPASVVQAWSLVVGDQVCEGDLDPAAPVPVAVPRPGPESNRAAWESWAIANGWKAEDAAVASQEDLEAVATEPTGGRPSDSARKAEWVDYVVGLGMPRENADARTKAELQAWVPSDEPELAETSQA